MEREWGREGTMLAKLIPIIFEITSELEKRKGTHPPTDELADDELAYQVAHWVVREYNERHGTKLWEASEAIQQTLASGFDQWVLFFRESGLETTVNENQLSRMFCHVNRHVLVRQDAPQEPRTPEQATTTMPAVTPPKLELRAFLDIPREPEGLQTWMEQEEALLVVAVYGADALVRAVDRGLVVLRLKAALLVWRAGQLLNALQDIREDWCRSGDQLLREMVGLWGIVHMGTAVASWRQHLPTEQQVAQDSTVARTTQTDTQTRRQERHCQTDIQTPQPVCDGTKGAWERQLQENRQMQTQQQQLIRQQEELVNFILDNYVGVDKNLGSEVIRSKRRFEKDREELAQLRQHPGAQAWLQRPLLQRQRKAEKAHKKKRREERKKLESWMDPEALVEIRALVYDFGPPAQVRKMQILQDEHGQYEDMEANGHRTGDDMAD
jgi:hypothetical protein